MRKLRVLLLAEAANPELTSVALIGYSLSQALAEVCDAHLVTESRNEHSLLQAGVSPAAFTAITNPAQRVAFRLSTLLRGGSSLGWTIHSALSTLAYPLFEHKVWRQFGARLAAGEFDLVHRITPLSPTTPCYLAKKLARLGVPLVLGPLNGGIPWPPGFGQVRRAEREWLGYFRDIHRLLPGRTATRDHAAALVLASRHTYGEVTAKLARREAKAIWLPENAIDPARFPEVLVEPPCPPAGVPPRVAFLGRLVPYKGADMLLEAALPLLRDGRMTLEFIGDGPQLADLKARVAAENLAATVDFPGWVAHTEVRRHLSKAQIFAFPSVREFGGGVVLEAMALGLAPVVIDYGGPAELIPPGCGTLVPMGNRDAIIREFQRVLTELTDDPAAVHAAGLRAQRHVRAHFTWAAKARQLLRVYAWALRGTPTPKPDLWKETAESAALPTAADSQLQRLTDDSCRAGTNGYTGVATDGIAPGRTDTGAMGQISKHISMSEVIDNTQEGPAAAIPVAVTITDSNFFIAVFTLLLSLQFHKVRAKAHVLSVNLSEEEKRLLRQFPGTQVIEATRDNPRGPACRKGEAILAAARISPEATHITLLDGDTLATGDITEHLCPEGETLFGRWKTPEEDGRIFAARYEPGEAVGGIPRHILQIWQQDVNERSTPMIHNTVCGGNLTVHRKALGFIQRWQSQMDKVLPENTLGAHNFSSKAYFQVDESVLNSLLAFAADAPTALPAKLNVDPLAYVAHLGPNNPKPWVLWRPEKLRYYPQVAGFFTWAKQQGYELPKVPWTFQQRNKLAVITSAHLFGAARWLKGRLKS